MSLCPRRGLCVCVWGGGRGGTSTMAQALLPTNGTPCLHAVCCLCMLHFAAEANKTFDGTPTTFASSTTGSYPYLQLSLGSVKQVVGVMLTVRGDAQLTLANKLDVFVTNATGTPPGAAVCTRSQAATYLGQVLNVVCDRMLAGSYVTVLRNATSTALHMAEVQPLVYGK